MISRLHTYHVCHALWTPPFSPLFTPVLGCSPPFPRICTIPKHSRGQGPGLSSLLLYLRAQQRVAHKAPSKYVLSQ